MEFQKLYIYMNNLQIFWNINCFDCQYAPRYLLDTYCTLFDKSYLCNIIQIVDRDGHDISVDCQGIMIFPRGICARSM